MRLEDFDFELPSELIAQYPPSSREDSRLLVVDREKNTNRAGNFPDMVACFREGDLLVLNDTRVIPARLLGHKDSGGKIEVLLVRRLEAEGEAWTCLTRSSKQPRPGTCLRLGETIRATVLPGGEPPFHCIRFECDGNFLELLERAGRIPLPPYIRRQDEPLDRERYQTVFADAPGAVAAPTAGLHFTDATLASLRQTGVEIRPLTLHVGLGTFLPVRVENILDHRMHGEIFDIPAPTASAVNRAREEGRRVWALGTTTVRTLEYAADENGRVRAGKGTTDLFIYPGFRFKVVTAMVTNFHLPQSTLMMLVSAFAGRERILSAYRLAVREKFRFFSYGDCMVIF
jgi:S-adenosylmethionine:tRNA ribosyltransferase-isomerase